MRLRTACISLSILIIGLFLGLLSVKTAFAIDPPLWGCATGNYAGIGSCNSDSPPNVNEPWDDRTGAALGNGLPSCRWAARQWNNMHPDQPQILEENVSCRNGCFLNKHGISATDYAKYECFVSSMSPALYVFCNRPPISKVPPYSASICEYTGAGGSPYAADGAVFCCNYGTCIETGPSYGTCNPTSAGACTGTRTVTHKCSPSTTESCIVKTETGPHWRDCVANSSNSCGTSGGTQTATWDCSANTTRNCNVSCGTCKLCQNGSCINDSSCTCLSDTDCRYNCMTPHCNTTAHYCQNTAVTNGTTQCVANSVIKWCCNGVCNGDNSSCSNEDGAAD